ncbi:protein of unknown function [Tenacibaculum sp. MAR_2009_124]|uniref:DUF4272 domain-containing protein n=1 Tax=Tenacibaculum sp. MAR_2009_124 TaxID=1250059 RepID=UPI000898CFD1|nr:DUF4272 domain-containing protein [Tenacibaculum sp. MAR_2009_124]SEB87318.1 protein of unknown function [Tenacibaculum sp. MAR_2009_124]
MNFLKKLFGIKDKTSKNEEKEIIVTPKEKVKETLNDKNLVEDSNEIESILQKENKPEILYESKVTVAIGGGKELSDENAFNTMGVSDENLKDEILKYYVWQSFGEDFDVISGKCTMKLIRLDVKEKYRPKVDIETVVSAFFKMLDEEDLEEKTNEGEIKPHPDLEKFKQVPWMTDLRLNNVSICLNAGFRPSNSLPTEFERKLRPSIEIAQRLNAIKALVLWLMVPQENLESDIIINFIEKNDLKGFMSEEEKEILNGSRDDEQARNAIGWKFENAWSLAWYFGYTEPEITGQMMSGEQMQEIMQDFSCPLDENIVNWTKNKQTLSESELLRKEDLFYCLHNAVRSAQLGRKTVPKGFDPMGNGGVIHERRHSLTWMLSKGLNWEETDLST